MAQSLASADVHAELEADEAEDKLDISVDKIDTGLYLGNLACARDQKTLRELGVTHVLTVDVVPLPRSVLRADLVFKFVQLADIPKDDLISLLPECNEFIQTAIDGGGTVLVHCYFGVSRSAGVVLGYAMQRYFLDYEAALRLVRAQRRFVQPNPGFAAQLKLYGQMGYILNKDDPRYKQFRLKMAGQRLKQVKILPQLFVELVRPDPGPARERPAPGGLRCRRCRRRLAAADNLIPHLPRPARPDVPTKGVRPTADTVADRTAENGQDLIQRLKNLASRDPEGAGTAPPAGTDRADEEPSHPDEYWSHLVDCAVAGPGPAAGACARMWFVEPLAWMAGVTRRPGGKLHCPQCHHKIGSFSWVCGCRCPCGHKVAPAFYLVPSKVEWADIVQNVQVTV